MCTEKRWRWCIWDQEEDQVNEAIIGSFIFQFFIFIFIFIFIFYFLFFIFEYNIIIWMILGYLYNSRNPKGGRGGNGGGSLCMYAEAITVEGLSHSLICLWISLNIWDFYLFLIFGLGAIECNGEDGEDGDGQYASGGGGGSGGGIALSAFIPTSTPIHRYKHRYRHRHKHINIDTDKHI